MKNVFLLALFILLSTPALAKIVTQEIAYKDGDVALTGYLAYDDSIKTPMPGVLVIHEWWGHNDYARMRADMLAKLGYAAFALDMYGTGVNADTPDAAQKLSKPFYDDRSLMQSRANTGLIFFKNLPQVDKNKIAVIGYCFGGTTALELARSGVNVNGIVSFHGGLSTPKPAAADSIKTRILALNGADDKFLAPNEMKNFLAEMTNAKVNFKSIDYAGATHAFSNPKATEIGQKFNIPIAYNEEADKKSWLDMQGFLKDIFK